MEFFAEVAGSPLDAADLKRLLTLARLPQLCASISTVIEDRIETGVIYCLWGEFAIRRDEIDQGCE